MPARLKAVLVPGEVQAARLGEAGAGRADGRGWYRAGGMKSLALWGLAQPLFGVLGQQIAQ